MSLQIPTGPYVLLNGIPHPVIWSEKGDTKSVNVLVKNTGLLVLRSSVLNPPTTPKKETKVKKHNHLLAVINTSTDKTITRAEILKNGALVTRCLPKAQHANLAADDALTLKRWGRQINRYFRMLKRDGHEIRRFQNIHGATTYTLIKPNTPAAPLVEPAPADPGSYSRGPRHFYIETEEKPVVSTKAPRVEEPTQVVSFADLMADLDDDVLQS